MHYVFFIVLPLLVFQLPPIIPRHYLVASVYLTLILDVIII